MTNTFRDVEFASVDGLAIRYARVGAATGMPILLTSPWPQSLQAFHAVWLELGKLGPLIAVDLPGFG